MLQKTVGEVESIFNDRIDLETLYTFDNGWDFYHFKKIREVPFRAVRDHYQAHILGYIAS